ncbi:hypothetical protein Rsub_04203 [Raphidocelis subcapitata]|uniref:Uncharacterized protein n=1 Tax=Raphidocelis subcapitata TaxID=307507 RepID=A0A2V0P0U2_9CHLO|nr:hypothetical protein Rsub_04203 [Raphidocelis subcapitata]|eukprot:GBF91463.1 hypothetical protein Rsub_04203 [Raphidocelis subcapitata]
MPAAALFLRQLVSAAASQQQQQAQQQPQAQQPSSGDGHASPSPDYSPPSQRRQGEQQQQEQPAAAAPASQLNWGWSRCRDVAVRIGRGLNSSGGAPGPGAVAQQPPLILETEHWLEAADPKHRYGANLRAYWSYWLEQLDLEERQCTAARRQSVDSGGGGGGGGRGGGGDAAGSGSGGSAAACGSGGGGGGGVSVAAPSGGATAQETAAEAAAAAAEAAAAVPSADAPPALAHWTAPRAGSRLLLHPTADDSQIANSGRQLLRRDLVASAGPSTTGGIGGGGIGAGGCSVGPHRFGAAAATLAAAAAAVAAAAAAAVGAVSLDEGDEAGPSRSVGLRRSQSAPRLKDLAHADGAAPAAAAPAPAARPGSSGGNAAFPGAGVAGAAAAAAAAAGGSAQPLAPQDGRRGQPQPQPQPPQQQQQQQQQPQPQPQPQPQQQPRKPPHRSAADARFFHWLDEGRGRDVDLSDLGVPRSKLEAERVAYLEEDELAALEVVVDAERGGLLVYRRSGAPVDTGSEMQLVARGGGDKAAKELQPLPQEQQQQQQQQEQEEEAEKEEEEGEKEHAPQQQQEQQQPLPPAPRERLVAPSAPVRVPRKKQKHKNGSKGFELDVCLLLSRTPPAAAAPRHPPGAQRDAGPAPAGPPRRSGVGAEPAPAAGQDAGAHAAEAAAAAAAEGAAAAAAAPSAAGAGGDVLCFQAKPSKWIFVLDTSGRMYVHAKRRGSFHHSSFLAGSAVLSAGGIVVRGGRILRLTGDSGHYKPSFESLFGVAQLLADWGADLSATKLTAKHIDCPLIV